MVLNFLKKDKPSDVEALKNRFSNLNPTGQDQSQNNVDPNVLQQNVSNQSNQFQQTPQVVDVTNVSLDQNQQFGQSQQQNSQQFPQNNMQQNNMNQNMYQQPQQNQFNQSNQFQNNSQEQFAQQNAMSYQNNIQQPQNNQAPQGQSVQSNQNNSSQATQSQEQPSQQPLPSWAVEEDYTNKTMPIMVEGASKNVDPVTESLESLRETYDDAKLNSLIIDQVKELIEIDSVLDSKIIDLSTNLDKEVIEREKLAKTVDEHFRKVVQLEKNMDKFVALYELVTNQFNPFVEGQVSNSASGTPANAIPPEKLQELKEMKEELTKTKIKTLPHPGIHEPLHPDDHFKLKDGKILTNIFDFISVLESMSDDTFSHHVSLDHNDFTPWIKEAMKLDDLSSTLEPISTRTEMLTVIRNYVKDHPSIKHPVKRDTKD